LTTVSAFADNIGTTTQKAKDGDVVTGFTRVGECAGADVSHTGSLIGPDRLLTAKDVNYRGCFEMPSVNEVPYEGLDQGTTTAIVAAEVFP